VAGQFVRVNAGGTGLDYVAGSAPYTDEQAQDAVGTILVDTATIDLTYTDATPSITAAIVAGSVNTTHLANDAVTYAKLQNVTDARLLGRSAGSAGDAQELTVAGQLSLSAGVLTGTGQPLDATLTTIAALVGTLDTMLYFTGTDTAALTALTAVGRTLLAATTQAAQRTALGLGTVATQPYEEGTFTVTSVGHTVAQTGTARYTKIGRVVVLSLPSLSGTSNATTFSMTGLPAALTPANQSNHLAPAQTDAGVVSCLVAVAPGAPTISATLWMTTGTWPATGTKNLYAPVLTYDLG
jgi:hypothetical protein